MGIGKNLNFAIHSVICIYMKDRESILGHVYHFENPKGEKYVHDGLLPVFLKNGHGQGYQD